MDNPEPDILKLIVAGDCVYGYDAVSDAAETWTVPTGMTWIVFLASGTNANRAATYSLAINDGAAKTLRTAVPEGENCITVMPLILYAGYTITLTDETFVAADVVTKVLGYWEVNNT